jgi:ribosomal protein L37AE/L43A
MGAEYTTTRSKKGVVYSKENNDIVDCLFCRIARGQSSANQLWYCDDQCAVFIPRGPAARLHLLVVPLEHIHNVTTLTEEHRPLLEHMKKVNDTIFSQNVKKYFILGSDRTTSCSFSVYWNDEISTVTSCTTAISLCF